MCHLEVPSLAISTRQQVLEQFWDDIESSSTNSAQEDCYFEYFETRFRTACQYDDTHGQICTVRNVCNIVHQIKEGKSREAIKADLSSTIDTTQEDDEGAFDNVIDLTIRLWLMVHMGKVPRGVTGQSTVAWQQGYLQAAIAYQFQHQLILTDSVNLQPEKRGAHCGCEDSMDAELDRSLKVQRGWEETGAQRFPSCYLSELSQKEARLEMIASTC